MTLSGNGARARGGHLVSGCSLTSALKKLEIDGNRTNLDGHNSGELACDLKISPSAPDNDKTNFARTNDEIVHLKARCCQPCLGFFFGATKR